MAAPGRSARTRSSIAVAAAATSSGERSPSLTPPTSVLWLMSGEHILSATGNPRPSAAGRRVLGVPRELPAAAQRIPVRSEQRRQIGHAEPRRRRRSPPRLRAADACPRPRAPDARRLRRRARRTRRERPCRRAPSRPARGTHSTGSRPPRARARPPRRDAPPTKAAARGNGPAPGRADDGPRHAERVGRRLRGEQEERSIASAAPGPSACSASP